MIFGILVQHIESLRNALDRFFLTVLVYLFYSLGQKREQNIADVTFLSYQLFLKIKNDGVIKLID